MPYNASDRKAIRRAERASALAERNRIAFLRSSMSTAPGRAWFYDLFLACHMFSGTPTFSANHDYFAAGERNIGLRLFADITTHCPDEYLLMMREAKTQEEINERLGNAVSSDNSESDSYSGPGATSEFSGSPQPGRDPSDESAEGWGAGYGSIDN